MCSCPHCADSFPFLPSIPSCSVFLCPSFSLSLFILFAAYKVFLAIRKVRLIEDLLLLTVSLRSDKQGGRDHARNFSNASTIERQNQLIAGKHSAIVTAAAGSSTGEDDDSVMELRRELQEALKRLPLPGNPSNAEISHSLIDENRGTTSSSTDQQAGVTQREGFLMGEGSVCEEGLRAAAESSSDAFFETWADRFRTMSVPLGKAPGADGGGTGGGQGTVDDGEEGGHIHQRKDDRYGATDYYTERRHITPGGLIRGVARHVSDW